MLPKNPGGVRVQAVVGLGRTVPIDFALSIFMAESRMIFRFSARIGGMYFYI
jgi:hypothetical protein